MRASERRSQRVQEAIERNQRYLKLTPEEQLASLDARLGKGVGASRERARITRVIEERAAADVAASKKRTRRERSSVKDK